MHGVVRMGRMGAAREVRRLQGEGVPGDGRRRAGARSTRRRSVFACSWRDDLALALDASGTRLQIPKVGAFAPHAFTALGREVADIGREFAELGAAHGLSKNGSRALIIFRGAGNLIAGHLVRRARQRRFAWSVRSDLDFHRRFFGGAPI